MGESDRVSTELSWDVAVSRALICSLPPPAPLLSSLPLPPAPAPPSTGARNSAVNTTTHSHPDAVGCDVADRKLLRPLVPARPPGTPNQPTSSYKHTAAGVLIRGAGGGHRPLDQHTSLKTRSVRWINRGVLRGWCADLGCPAHQSSDSGYVNETVFLDTREILACAVKERQ